MLQQQGDWEEPDSPLSDRSARQNTSPSPHWRQPHFTLCENLRNIAPFLLTWLVWFFLQHQNVKYLEKRKKEFLCLSAFEMTTVFSGL